ncbi:MAG TPA: hypothetical protein PK530_15890 [Anaerolineales bacterium]|nr:hypothetical protein [Anaerolineales bacterium]
MSRMWMGEQLYLVFVSESGATRTAQHSVQWIGGILRDLQAFLGLWLFLLPSGIQARPPTTNASR